MDFRPRPKHGRLLHRKIQSQNRPTNPPSPRRNASSQRRPIPRKSPHRPTRRHLRSPQRRRGRIHPNFHLPRLPICRHLRPRLPTRYQRHRRHRHKQRPARSLNLQLLKQTPKSALQQHLLGSTRQFRLRPHGLPPTRRTPRLDSRRPSLCPHSRLQYGHLRLLHQMARRHSR